MTGVPPEQAPTPRLPFELRRVIPVTVAIGIVGLALFLVGFTMGVFAGGAAIVIALGATVVVIVAATVLVCIGRIGRT